MTPAAPPKTLWALFALQLFCAVFFIVDAILDILGIEDSTGLRNIDSFEYAVAAALFLGVIYTGYQIRSILRRNAQLKDQIRLASGEFSELLEEHFRNWKLTVAERDVAVLAIKGLSIAEIAAARGTAEGTVKAHSAAVYRKAGVSGRLQLLSLFVDELMDGVGAT